MLKYPEAAALREPWGAMLQVPGGRRATAPDVLLHMPGGRRAAGALRPSFCGSLEVIVLQVPDVRSGECRKRSCCRSPEATCCLKTRRPSCCK